MLKYTQIFAQTYAKVLSILYLSQQGRVGSFFTLVDAQGILK